MTFFTEATTYEKTVLSDLQGAWGVLRNDIVNADNLRDMPNIIFHIDEAMSWETVRNLESMKPIIILIRNIALQGKASEDILQCIDDIQEIYNEVIQSYNKNKV